MTEPPSDSLLRRVLREPILHFLLIGAALYGAVEFWQPAAADRFRIVVDRPMVELLAKTYQSQFGQPPGEVELKALVDRYVEDEMLYREGIALSLDRADEVVRRRIVQKVRFLTEDRAAIEAPDEAALVRYFEANRQRYALPETVSFSHVYFSPDQAGEDAARAAATADLTKLAKSGLDRAPERGDRFPGPGDLAAAAVADLGRLFGSSSELVAALAEAPVGAWSGPYRSGYGWHLVFVSARDAERPVPFAEVRQQVEQDYVQAERARRNEEGLDLIRGKYTVVRNDQQ